MRKLTVKVSLASAVVIFGILLGVLAVHETQTCGCSPEPPTLRIVSGAENQPLEPIIQEYADQQNITIELTYEGSVEIMQDLAAGAESRYDAVWPANSLWIALGDTDSNVQYATSIMRSPVVFGVKRSVAERLGWVGTDVSADDILTAAESGQLRFMMASASQSDSGAAAYLGFLYAFAGHPNVLTSDNLLDPVVQDKLKRVIGAQSRTAGNSAWLRDLFVQQYGAYDAMVNYEALVIEANQQLVAAGQEPLYVVYPVDATTIADSPLGFISSSTDKEEMFRGLQTYLLTSDVQGRLLGLGRRTGLGINIDPANVDPAIFNPEWGIDTQRILTPITIPEANVVREAINLYQSTFRKPSISVFVLDFSGSMADDGEEDLKRAMNLLLDQELAAQYFLQAAPSDITVVIPFNDEVLDVWIVQGNDPHKLSSLANQIQQTDAGGGTNIYDPVMRALDVIKAQQLDGHFPAVFLMTDGQDRSNTDIGDLRDYVARTGMDDVPVFAITFGDASRKQLEQIADLTSGAVFDGRSDLVGAFRQARSYN